jgi:carbon monoxide dehydrogenase subunit G
MRVIKLAILSFIFLFLLVTIISLFIPSHIRISKATEINNTKETVMSFIANPVKWGEWYPGVDSLTIMYIDGKPKGILLDTSGLVGIAIIDSNDSTVTAANVGLRVKQQMDMGWKVLAGSNENNVVLQWYVDFKLKWYPWEKFKSLFFENMYGVQMEQGLANLKELSEGRRSSIN